MSTPNISHTEAGLRFSIIIPTYNEAEDIADTLDALLRLEYPRYDVVVVDESTDDTPAIVRAYPSERVRYVRQTRGSGRSAARNQGILEAAGDVVVILNADVSLPVDFLARLERHYNAGADYVLVESAVSNVEHLLPRYVQAQHSFYYGPDTTVDMNWTEGFSCRRTAALAVGLVPEGAAVPLVAGEDGWFGERLAAEGFRKVFDRSLVVTHVVPERLGAFFRQRVGRGHGTGQIWLVRAGISRRALAWRALRETLFAALAALLVWPQLRYARRLAAHSPRGLADTGPFAAVFYLEKIANLLGIWYSYLEARRVRPIPAQAGGAAPR